jgi:membrane protease YdiL (CAAX protease family)
VSGRLIANVTQFLYFQVPWGSRLLSIMACLICYFLFNKYFADNNYFRLKQERNQIRITILLSITLIVGYTIIFFIRGYAQNFNIEDFLFYSIVVGTEEELIFRGILLGLLMSSMKDNVLFIKYPAALLCGIFFGFYHGNFYYFDYIHVITNCIFGYIIGIIAIKNKSIFIPIIVHNIVNTLGYIIQTTMK